MSQDIVCMKNVRRYYGDKPDLVAKYEQIAASGKCPFCEPHMEAEVAWRAKLWVVVKNQFPYNNTRFHWLVLPKRHVTELKELSAEEWADMEKVVGLADFFNPLPLCNGYGMAIREGLMGGVTLYHLHWHLILPEAGEDGAIPVNFGIG